MAGTEFCFRRSHMCFLERAWNLYAAVKIVLAWWGFFLTVVFGLACDTEMSLGNFVTSVVWLNLVCNNMTKYGKKWCMKRGVIKSSLTSSDFNLWSNQGKRNQLILILVSLTCANQNDSNLTLGSVSKTMLLLSSTGFNSPKMPP